jgi:hypothetical protein
MNTKKYLIIAGITVVLLGGISSSTLAAINYFYPKPMVVQISSGGNVLLRGTINSVNSNSITVKGWGGNWVVNTSSSTQFVPGSDMSQFKAGDFVGVQGNVSQSASWTIDATLVRDWTQKQPAQNQTNSPPPIGQCGQPDAQGKCPAGCMYYGNPLGCVTQEYYAYCNGYPRGNCPVCLASNTNILTPSGSINVKNIKVGDSVWSVDKNGNRIKSIVIKTGSTVVPANHQVVHLVLSDKREVWVSPNHPTVSNTPVGSLKVGDLYDGARVQSAELIPYWDNKTYDILPNSDTGYYWADGILLGSTLTP